MSKKNIYIEVGVCDLSYNTKKFYEEHKNEQWDYYLFEPNYVSFEAIVKQNKTLQIPNITIIKKAVWDKNCKKKFWVGTRLDRLGNHRARGGSSLLFGKKYLGTETKKIKCIDFDKWIRKNFSKKDYIHLRMDIEGAEYKVLSKMIEKKSINYINCISVEFHAHKFQNENRKKLEIMHKKIKKFFSNCKNIKIEALESIERVK